MMQCEIVTPEKRMYSDEAYFVVIPAAEGEMGIYPQHEPIVTTLNLGVVRLTKQDEDKPTRFIVAGGYAQIEGDRVRILADRAAALAELQLTELRVRTDELKEKLADLKEGDPNAAYLSSEIAWNEELIATVPLLD